jgi:hypothetical protein
MSGLIALLALGAALSIASTSMAGPASLGSAADYAVVGVGGTVNITSDMAVYQSATVVNGNVAQGPYTSLTHGVDATINGRWDYDNTDGLPASNNGLGNPTTVGVTGAITGGIFQKDLTGVAADARAAAAADMVFAPTQVFATLAEGQTIIGNGGMNVIQITGDVTLKTTLTLQGTASDSFIFQFTANDATSAKQLTLSGMSMNITGVNANNIYWVFNGTGGQLAITSGSIVYGNFLAPDRGITVDHGTIVGRVIGGGSGTELNIHSGSTIDVPVPDAGSTVALLGIALAGIEGVRRLIRARKA